VSDNISQDVAIRGEGNIVVGKGDVVFNPIPPAEAQLRRDLGILLKNVENTWIKGVLEKSVHEAALLDLGMELREEAVDNPWRMVMESSDQSREALPQGRKIKDIFDEANRLLLILGEPGSGKTTTLLQLARDLIAEVDEAFTQPVPVFLNLSTWTNKQQPLDEWLIGELNSKYRLPKKDGKKWLTDRRILPLLDGLDEVIAENRAACVENINQLVDDYGLHGLVVCSRVKDYTDLDVRLAFYRAIYLQPLTPEQVNEYLNQAGDKLADLRATLQSDDALQEMAQSPLILNIMSLAYKDKTSKPSSDSSLNTKEARTKHLFETYITRMFSRKGEQQGFDIEQTEQWLSWLARNMYKHNQDVFLIEDLQPSWLNMRSWQWAYFLASRMIGAVALGVGNRFKFILDFLLIFGLPIGLLDALHAEWIRKWPRNIENSKLFRWFFIVIIWLSIWLSNSLFKRLEIYSPEGAYGLYLRAVFWPLVGIIIFGLRSIQRNMENDIQTFEGLGWDWRKALKGMFIGGIIGILVVGPLISISAFTIIEIMEESYPSDPLPFPQLSKLNLALLVGLLFSILLWPISGFIGAVLNGIKSKILETKSYPNQGIRLSIKSAVVMGSIVGLLFALIVGLYFGLQGYISRIIEDPSPLPPIFSWVSSCFFFGLAVGLLRYGGLDIIQHYILRLILIMQGHMPRDYARFLDYAVDRIFLQKVGGGYRFIHRMLLEHFANMQETE